MQFSYSTDIHTVCCHGLEAVLSWLACFPFLSSEDVMCWLCQSWRSIQYRSRGRSTIQLLFAIKLSLFGQLLCCAALLDGYPHCVLPCLETVLSWVALFFPSVKRRCNVLAVNPGAQFTTWSRGRSTVQLSSPSNVPYASLTP